MILLILAALAQTATATIDSREELLLCSAATAVAATDDSGKVPFSYYLKAAVRDDPQGRQLGERLMAMMAEVPPLAAVFRDGGAQEGRAAAVASECDRQYPLARAQVEVRLPVDSLDRDILCVGMINLFIGMWPDEAPAGATTRGRLEQVGRAFEARLTEERLRQAGLLETAAVLRRTTELLFSSLDLGNVEMVNRACISSLRD